MGPYQRSGDINGEMKNGGLQFAFPSPNFVEHIRIPIPRIRVEEKVFHYNIDYSGGAHACPPKAKQLNYLM